jgi:hypothetical protein
LKIQWLIKKSWKIYRIKATYDVQFLKTLQCLMSSRERDKVVSLWWFEKSKGM